MIISMIVAHGKKFEIGLNNKLLWNLKDDLLLFKEMTMGKTLIMGRKTFESIGRPLPGRKFIVISRLGKIEAKSTEGIIIKKSLEDALSFAKESGVEEVFIAGGGEIYKEAFPLIQKLYTTVVEYEGPFDTSFPHYQLSDFKIVLEKTFEKNERNELPFRFYSLERLSN